MPHKHRDGFDRDENDFGRNREYDIPEGEPAAQPGPMPAREHPDNE